MDQSSSRIGPSTTSGDASSAFSAPLEAAKLIIEVARSFLTLSSLIAVSLLAYKAALDEPFEWRSPFGWSIGLFLLNSVLSIVNMAYFIRKVNSNSIDIEAGSSRLLTAAVIGTFLLAVGVAGYAFLNDYKQGGPNENEQNNITLELSEGVNRLTLPSKYSGKIMLHRNATGDTSITVEEGG